ncbi:MAG TPA: hypothetical protein VFA85_06650 [Terriglobales bacterium]|nr:hypothetical protein [Terriglobales bacterium]
MLRYYYINRDWMTSATARRVYRVAASLSLMLFCLLFELHLTGTISRYLIPFLKPILLAGVLGAATTMVAMEYFLFGFDESSALKKMFWFLVMLLPPLGPPLYCFFIYSRSPVLSAQEDHQVRSASV